MNQVSVGKTMSLINEKHAGQVDLAGLNYVEHLTRVAATACDLSLEFKNFPTSLRDIYTVGLLHDIVEDTDMTIMELSLMGYSAEILRAIEAITKVEGYSYGEYIERVKRNDLACLVKLADLMTNMDIRGLPADKVCEMRLKRYRNAYKTLSEHLTQKYRTRNPSLLKAPGVA